MQPLVDLRAMFPLYLAHENVNLSEIPSPVSKHSETDVYYGEFITYIVLGLLLIMVNTPILVNILRHSVLRAKKEYLLFAGMLQ
jgi:hypothetical protein